MIICLQSSHHDEMSAAPSVLAGCDQFSTAGVATIHSKTNLDEEKVNRFRVLDTDRHGLARADSSRTGGRVEVKRRNTENMARSAVACPTCLELPNHLSNLATLNCKYQNSVNMPKPPTEVRLSTWSSNAHATVLCFCCCSSSHCSNPPKREGSGQRPKQARLVQIHAPHQAIEHMQAHEDNKALKLPAQLCRLSNPSHRSHKPCLVIVGDHVNPREIQRVDRSRGPILHAPC